jgi:hypothetical protein
LSSAAMSSSISMAKPFRRREMMVQNQRKT